MKKNILTFCHPYQSNIFKESFTTSGGISASNGIIEGSLLIWLPFTTISNSCFSEVQSICCWTKTILSNLSLRQVYFGTLEKFRSSKNQSDSLLFQTHLAKPSCLGLASISSPLLWPKWTVFMTRKLSNRVRRRKSQLWPALLSGKSTDTIMIDFKGNHSGASSHTKPRKL